MRSRRSSMVFWICAKPKRLRTRKTIRKQTSVQIIRPGTTVIRELAATGISKIRFPLDQDEGQEAADQTVEDDGLGQREADPHDSLKLTAQLRLARDRLDHRAEDVAQADAGAERAEADTESERERLSHLGDVAGQCCEDGHGVPFVSDCCRKHGLARPSENRAGLGRREYSYRKRYGCD